MTHGSTLARAWALTAGLFVFVTLPAMGQTQARYGALALDEATGGYGWAVDFSTQDEASTRALNECRARACRVVMTFSNSCAAFARGSGSTYGWARGSDYASVQVEAVRQCSTRGPGCVVRVWGCTS